MLSRAQFDAFQQKCEPLKDILAERAKVMERLQGQSALMRRVGLKAVNGVVVLVLLLISCISMSVRFAGLIHRHRKLVVLLLLALVAYHLVSLRVSSPRAPPVPVLSTLLVRIAALPPLNRIAFLQPISDIPTSEPAADLISGATPSETDATPSAPLDSCNHEL